MGRCCPRCQCHMRPLGEHRLLTAAWSTCNHRLRNRVLPFRQGQGFNAKYTKEGDFPGLFDVLGEEGASQGDLTAVGEQFFVALYGQPSGSSMTQARYKLYTRTQGKRMRIMSLPPTDLKLFLHVKRAHLQMLLWKAPDQLGPPDVSITEYGWEIQDGQICPSIYSGPPGPPLLMNVISCRAKGNSPGPVFMSRS